MRNYKKHWLAFAICNSGQMNGIFAIRNNSGITNSEK
jgi:hypothetical protein